MFLGPYSEGGEFSDAGIRGVWRFLERVWRAVQLAEDGDRTDEARERRRHQLIARVDERIGQLQYNTAIAFLMEFTRDLDAEAAAGRGRRLDAETLLRLLAPFAPHLAEELWERTGHQGSIHDAGWPESDPALAAAIEVEVVIQLNGKRLASTRRLEPLTARLPTKKPLPNRADNIAATAMSTSAPMPAYSDTRSS